MCMHSIIVYDIISIREKNAHKKKLTGARQGQLRKEAISQTLGYGSTIILLSVLAWWSPPGRLMCYDTTDRHYVQQLVLLWY